MRETIGAEMGVGLGALAGLQNAPRDGEMPLGKVPELRSEDSDIYFASVLSVRSLTSSRELYTENVAPAH